MKKKLNFLLILFLKTQTFLTNKQIKVQSYIRTVGRIYPNNVAHVHLRWRSRLQRNEFIALWYQYFDWHCGSRLQSAHSCLVLHGHQSNRYDTGYASNGLLWLDILLLHSNLISFFKRCLCILKLNFSFQK
jgi:hypothetical protein